MKPLKLVLKNIGPFLDETIDFTKLDDIFLITGNTGAGKTFIFDAMTYALYGVLKGNRSGQVKSIKSRYADENETEYYVEFTFQIADKIYKVNRTVPFTKPGNSTETPSVIVFWKKKIEDDDFTVVCDSKKTAGVNKKIESIIGLTADEFSKIVLLPQGAFAEFLKQNSNERGKTLEKLFPVDDYKKLIDAVEKRKDQLKKKEDDLNAKLEGELTSLKDADLDFEDAEENIKNLENEIAGLEKKESEYQEKARDYSRQTAELEHDFNDAVEKENNEKKKTELESRKKEIDGLSEKIEKAEKANELRETINQKKALEEKVTEAQKEKNDADSTFNKAKESLDQLEAKRQKMEKLNESNSADKTKLDSLKEKLSKKDDYEESIKIEAAASAEKEKAEVKKRELESERDKASEPIKGKKIDECISLKQEEVFNLLTDKKNCMTKSEQAEKRDAQLKEKNNLESERNKIREELAAADDKVIRTENTLNEKKQEFEDFKVRNSAFYISKFLKAGEACPVCGSKEHPCPAESPAGLLNPEETVKVYEDALNTAKKQAEELNRKDSELSAELKAIDDVLKMYEGLAETKEILKELKAAELSYNKAVSEQKELSDLQTKLSELEEKITAATENVHDKEIAYSVALTNRDALKKELGKNIENLQSEYDQLKEKYTLNFSAYEKWSTDIAAAREEYSSASASKEEKEKQLSKFQSELCDAAEKLSSELEQSIFAKIEDAEKAMMSLDELSDNRDVCQEYFSELKSVKDALKASRKLKASEEIQKDIKALEVLITENNDESEKNSQELKSKRNTLVLYKTSFDKIKHFMKELQKISKEAEPCIKLYKDLSGGNDKALRFDTWALGMYFDQIVDFASERFFEISNHRFEFTYKDIDEKTGKGGKSFRGLDLMVVDHNTPDKGPTDTSDLSGGETFEASISLALAVTDVVQNNNGGISLDSLFIDEGFGTLGPEPLETTMKVLNELSETKMIGLISHVDSLQDADGGITSQIQVEKTDHGSSISIK